ncbi:MAG: hypothetical protein H0T46_08255 [Deltaproteobacteria bacterium]|nr:hypothetical protein [Deltaproteobacteria bacterium]
MALDLIAELETLVDAFERDGVDYALCGGLSLAIHGHPRATMDIDVLVPSAAAPHALASARSVGFDVPARVITFGLRTGSPRTVQRVSKLDPETNDLVSLDVMHADPGFEDVWAGRLQVPWRGRDLRIVSRDGLATMKRFAARPQDLADLAKLEGTDDDEG